MKKLVLITTITILLVPIFCLGQNCENNSTKKKNFEEMKSILVKKIHFNTNIPSISEVKKELDALNVEFHLIDEINWRDYPYNPEVKFRIAYSDTEIYLQFMVKEHDTRATFGEDEGSRPYTDSCVEFFMIPSDKDTIYYNLEMNCIGYGTFSGGELRHNRTKFPYKVISKIRRESTLGNKPFGEKEGDVEWSLTLAVPISLYSLSVFTPLTGRRVKANFYKCGDNMKTPHYLSWNPIGTERPNFHTPDYFGTIVFE